MVYIQADGEPLGEDWLGGQDEPLRGFRWRGGCERETTGIVLWSQPFPVTLPTGEKVSKLHFVNDLKTCIAGATVLRELSVTAGEH